MCFTAACCLLVFLLPTRFSPGTLAQAPSPRERLRGVLSRTSLLPELHGDSAIRFSPDGKFLFVQDLAGVMLLSRDPLQLISYIDSVYAYPARFSADSQTLMLLSSDLTFARWRVSDGARLESRDLPIPTGCLSLSLSPNGDFLSCLTPDLDFALYRLDSGLKVFSASLHPQPGGHFPVPIRLDIRSAFSAPFGYILANDWKPLANRRLVRMPAWFSPDSKFVIAGDMMSSLRVNLATFKKENLPSLVRGHFSAVAGVLSGERVLIIDEPKHQASVVSLSSGNVISTANIPANAVLLPGDSRFALLRNVADQNVRILDLQTSQVLPGMECASADFHDDLIALLTKERSIKFFRVGQADAFLGARLPLTGLPPLIAAGVSPNLDSLAFAVDGAGAVFQLPDGRALSSEKRFGGATLSDTGHFTFVSFMPSKPWVEVSRFDDRNHTFASAWIPQEGGELHPGQNAFIEYSLKSEFGRGFVINLTTNDIPYRLRGLDPASGAQLWQQTFEHGTPIPFSDPQGDRFVLAWNAKSEGAAGALKKWKERCSDCKHAKIAEQDTVFDVRDSRTGQSLGVVLVQIGAGAVNFSSAYSVGQALFVIKDDIRVSVFSIDNGKLIGHVKGLRPAANAQSKLFVLDEGAGRLGFYDLSTCEKIEQQQFPDEIAYTHFSADGKKLVVLTQHQQVFVLDTSQVRERPLPPAHENTESSDSLIDKP